MSCLIKSVVYLSVGKGEKTYKEHMVVGTNNGSLQSRWKLVKNLPAMRETWNRSLGWEDPLEKGKAIHSSILAWRIPWTV